MPLVLSSLHLNKLSPALVLLSILWLGFGLRLYRLGEQNIWWDEGHAIWTARHSLVQATDITAHDVHPPLYLWLLHGWLRVAGESEFAARYLSTIGGTLTVALTYVVARRLLGRRAALLAMLLLAISRFHIWWSQETRMYIWATLFALLSICGMMRLRQGGHGVWWLYVFSSAAAIYTLYLTVLVLLLENLFVALTGWLGPRRRRFLFNWCLAQVSILLLYTPWLFAALSRTRTDVAKSSFPFQLIWQLYGTVLATGISTDLDRYTWLLVLFGLLAAAGICLLFFDRHQPQRYGFASWEIGLLLLLPLALPPLAVYALSIPRGFFYSPKPEARYLLIFAPLFYILLAGTIASFWQKGRWGRILTVAATILVLGTFVSVLPGHYAGRYMRDEYQTAMQTLEAHVQPGDAVLLVSGDRYPVFLYYYHRIFTDPDSRPPVYLMPQYNTVFTPQNVESELAPLAERHSRLWLASVERTLQDPENLVEQWLNAHRSPALDVKQGHNYLRLYDGGTAPSPAQPVASITSARPQYPLHQALGQGLLLGYDLATSEFRPGDWIQPALYVETADALDLELHWLNPNGQLAAQQTVTTPRPERGRQIVRIPAAFAAYEYTEPGGYSLEVCPADREDNCAILPVGEITHSRHLPGDRPAVQRQVEIEDGAVRLLGYTVRPAEEVRAGKTLTVYLYWQAEIRLDQDYTVFVHLLGPYNPATGGPVWAQDDSYPLKGGHPTSRWLPGQVVTDRHDLILPQDTPPGTFEIEVGLYDARTGNRLDVAESDQDRILLDNILITRP